MTTPPIDQRIAAAIAPALVRLGISPNLVTAISLALSLAAAGLFAWGSGAAIHWAAGVFLVSRFIDHIDGELARQAGKSSRFGHYFDAVTGMISYAALFLGIAVGLWRGGAGQWTVALALVVALAIVLNTALQLRLEAHQWAGLSSSLRIRCSSSAASTPEASIAARTLGSETIGSRNGKPNSINANGSLASSAATQNPIAFSRSAAPSAANNFHTAPV